ncbi:10537_t:CDS:2, partial [Cetraspora pellucida]
QNEDYLIEIENKQLDKIRINRQLGDGKDGEDNKNDKDNKDDEDDESNENDKDDKDVRDDDETRIDN